MTFFKLSALALASTLALTGCGSDSDNTSNSNNNNNGSVIPPKPPVDNSLSDLEQAKSLINTAKQFILDNQAISDAYENASSILTEKQEQRINATFDLPEDIFSYMTKNNVSTLNTAQIIALANDQEFKKALGSNVTINPNSNFNASLSADGQFQLTGSTVVNTKEYDYIYNPKTQRYEQTLISQDTFTTSYDSYKNALSSNTSTADFKGSYGFKSINIGSGTDAVIFSSISQGATVNAKFSDKVVVNEEFGLSAANEAGITLEKATIKLGDVKMQANDSIIEARNLEVAFLDLSHKLANGSLAVRTLPSTIKLTGQLIKGKPATNATITLNAVANEADIRNIIKVTQAGNIEEAANKFVGLEIVLSLKGTVARKNTGTTTSIPLDIQANLKRTARNVIELQGLNASVDNKKLYVTGKTTLDANYNAIGTELTITQNKAAVVLKLDANTDFIKQNMTTGKVADITVNGKVLGELLENNGSVNAKFIDNSFIPLG